MNFSIVQIWTPKQLVKKLKKKQLLQRFVEVKGVVWLKSKQRFVKVKGVVVEEQIKRSCVVEEQIKRSCVIEEQKSKVKSKFHFEYFWGKIAKFRGGQIWH